MIERYAFGPSRQLESTSPVARPRPIDSERDDKRGETKKPLAKQATQIDVNSFEGTSSRAPTLKKFKSSPSL